MTGKIMKKEPCNLTAHLARRKPSFCHEAAPWLHFSLKLPTNAIGSHHLTKQAIRILISESRRKRWRNHGIFICFCLLRCCRKATSSCSEKNFKWKQRGYYNQYADRKQSYRQHIWHVPALASTWIRIQLSFDNVVRSLNSIKDFKV